MLFHPTELKYKEEKIMSKENELYESFDGTEYKWNGIPCTAELYYQSPNKKAKTKFCIIKKIDARWDDAQPSYSTGWICDGKYFVLGLPTKKDDIQKLIDTLEELKSRVAK